jgi:hypothetical protein
LIFALCKQARLVMWGISSSTDQKASFAQWSWLGVAALVLHPMFFHTSCLGAPIFLQHPMGSPKHRCSYGMRSGNLLHSYRTVGQFIDNLNIEDCDFPCLY